MKNKKQGHNFPKLCPCFFTFMSFLERTLDENKVFIYFVYLVVVILKSMCHTN